MNTTPDSRQRTRRQQQREAVDVVMMSTHGRTGLDHLLLGSITEKVIARAHCPVLAIPALNRHDPVFQAA